MLCKTKIAIVTLQTSGVKVAFISLNYKLQFVFLFRRLLPHPNYIQLLIKLVFFSFLSFQIKGKRLEFASLNPIKLITR